MSSYDEYINSAAEHFKKLLIAQLDRQLSMEQAVEPKKFAPGQKVVIGLVPGDGIGPIIFTAAERVLKQLLSDEIAAGTVVLKNINGLTIENRMAQGKSVPDDVLAEIKSCDVLLKGPTTTPKGGTMESANVFLRKALDLYANVRPVSVPEQGIDWTFFRENTEGEYALGSSGIEIPGKLTMDFKVTTDAGTRRIARAAFEYAKQNGKNHVSIVTKANIMKKTDGSFSEICHEIAAEYPEITAEDYYIDIMTANLVNEKSRNKFQVFVLPNLYGDIITDEAAQIQGGVGTAGSSNTGDQYAMFEAIHGSAPRMIEAGFGAYANPSSILTATVMLLRHIGRQKEAEKLDKALELCVNGGKARPITGRPDGATCEEFAEQLSNMVAALEVASPEQLGKPDPTATWDDVKVLRKTRKLLDDIENNPAITDYTHEQVVAFTLLHFENEVSNGGLGRFYLSPNSWYASMVSESLEEVGCSYIRKAYDDFNAANGIDVLDLSSIRNNYYDEEEFQERFDFDSFDRLFRVLNAKLYNNLVAYVRTHYENIFTK